MRGKQGAKIDVGLALMALNLKKMSRYMGRKDLSNKKTHWILMIKIKIQRVFLFFRLMSQTRFFLKFLKPKRLLSRPFFCVHVNSK
ncbi:hypothetical protein DVW83_11375 [Enterococcus sp. VV15]|nr:hypothetical protein DVW83_11375 [Enterococcus sp. VV15]